MVTTEDDVIIGPGQVRIPAAKSSLMGRAAVTYAPYREAPMNPETRIETARSISAVRDFLRLLEMRHQVSAADHVAQPEAPLDQVKQVKITGTLFPCGLLSAGWWQHATPPEKQKFNWLSPVQEWHFVGFNEWVPSWDFSWDFENDGRAAQQDKYFAQFGDGDEADSLPLVMSSRHAKVVYQARQDWGGLRATITCFLAHRTKFPGIQEQQELRDAGGWLNYCLWLDPDNPRHGIEPMATEPDLYSGYLWKCLAPRAWVQTRPLSVRDVFFIWTHTDFSKPDAVAFGLELLEAKQALLGRHVKEAQDLVMLAKSSPHVPGQQLWGRQEFFNLLDLRRVPPSPAAS